jgi:hypothetical protein
MTLENPIVTGVLSQHYDEDKPKWDTPEASGNRVFATGDFTEDSSGNIVPLSVVFDSNVVSADHPLVQKYIDDGVEVSFTKLKGIS